jgi:hypothetical protein
MTSAAINAAASDAEGVLRQDIAQVGMGGVPVELGRGSG